MTTKNYLATTAGAITLDLIQGSGKTTIRTDPLAKYADVRISSTGDNPAVEAAEIIEHDGTLTVRVKGSGGSVSGITIDGNGNIFGDGFSVGSNGSVVVTGSGMSVSSSSRGVFVNGVDINNLVATSGTKPPGVITTEVVLPYGSSVVINIGGGSATVQGPLHVLDAQISSGDLVQTKTVAEAIVNVSSGSAQLGTVLNDLDLSISSGSGSVASYEGSSGRVSASSGSFVVRCSPKSSGRLSASVSSGSGSITGSGHLTVRQSKSSGSLRVF